MTQGPEQPGTGAPPPGQHPEAAPPPPPPPAYATQYVAPPGQPQYQQPQQYQQPPAGYPQQPPPGYPQQPPPGYSQQPPPGYPQQPPPGYPQQAPPGYLPPPGYGPQQYAVAQYAQPGPPGKPRSIGVSILLAIVTIGIYAFVWTYKTHKEMKQASGQGVGGPLGLIIYIIFSPATFFLIPSEVGQLYASRGLTPPVKGMTGLWILVPLLGAFIWFFKVQGALNHFWQGTAQR